MTTKRLSHSDDMQEVASLYALGGLDDAEREEFETHLRQGCPEC